MQAISVQGSRASSRFVVPETWEPVGHLGSGAYAAVALFRGPKGELYAVKKAERVLDHPILALRTLREVRLLAHFRHPNVLSIHRLFLDGPETGDCHLCLEAMDGDLQLLIHGSKQALAEQQVQCVLYQILRGLLCLRTAHVVHRDLKPSNVLIRATGEVKLADLGLARAIDADADHEGQDAQALTEYVVTRFYRAPEVVLTATRYTYAVDMWSAGCILGEMLTRQPLFQGKDALDQIRKIVMFLGRQPQEDTAWLAGASRKFVEQCNRPAPGQGLGLLKLLRSPEVNGLATELMARMLRFDPAKRVSVDDALLHQYLGSFDAANDPEVASARAVPAVDWCFDRALCFDEGGRPRPYEKQRFRRALREAADLLEQGSSKGANSGSGACGRGEDDTAAGAAAAAPAAPIRATESGGGRRRAERAR